MFLWGWCLRCWNHIELADDLISLLDIESKWLQRWINQALVLVKSFFLCNKLQILYALADEGTDIIDLGKHLRIIVLLNELNQFIIDNLNVLDLLIVLVKHLSLREDLVLFSKVLVRKLSLQFFSLLLQLLNQVSKSFVDVSKLLIL